MDLIVKHFDELSTNELYEILKTRSEIFVVEQDCVYQDHDDKGQDAIHVFCLNDEGRFVLCFLSWELQMAGRTFLLTSL